MMSLSDLALPAPSHDGARKYGLAIDPGMSTGICLFSWGNGPGQFFRRKESWQFRGGAPKLAQFLDLRGVRVGPTGRLQYDNRTLDALVVEKFTPRGGAGFSLTQVSAEPLRGEGVLIGRGFEPFIQWAQPAQQYFMGGVDLADKKKRSREFLKLNDLHITGSMVGQPDADDAISAELHAIAWLRRQRHRPTLEKFFASIEKNEKEE